MKLGMTIASLRRQKGWKQQDLAEELGISPSYLSQVEHERKEPSLSLLRGISNTLEVPLPFLFFMSLSRDDIPERKREAYDILSPVAHSLIQSVLDANPELSNA